ncbi:MAG: tetratricopeptide repeat protein [Deltaproteobacteria bacterium]|nr:tetratricopeptide repeat protein [Deltaproteobacteria bacterium]
MDKLSFFKNGLGKAAALSAVMILSAMPLGCSKSDNSAVQNQEQQAAPATATVDPGKEHFEKGVQLSLKGQYDEAIKEYEITIQHNPKSAEAHNNLGFAYMDKGDVDKAIEHQKHAIEADPNLANGYFGLAMALEKKGDKKGALENWKKFAELSQPHSKWWMKAQEHIAALGGAKKAPAAKKN